MALKRKISYQLKLFLPMAGMVWLIVIGFFVLQLEREKAYRSEYLSNRLDFINRRVIDLYDTNQDLVPFMNFIDHYYDTSVLDALSLTLYDAQDGSIIRRIGFPAPPPEELKSRTGAIKGADIQAKNNDSIYYFSPDKAFYYNVDHTSDGKVLVQTILPYAENLKREVSGGFFWWVILFGSCFAVTVATWVITRHVSRNVKLLSVFATNAANDYDFVSLDSFSNDELGEISRQIVNIYNMRKAAIASRELEHRVALKATEERSNLKRQLTNNINHELKTPAGIIKGYLETIMENPGMDEDSRRHFLEKARYHIDRLCNILNDLSTITRLEDGSSKIMLEEINFHDFVASMAVDIEESRLIGDMAFDYDIPDDCTVKGNISLLTAALMNLVKNAAAYSSGTRMGIRLFTSNSRFYTFVFYDDGTGVAEEHLPMLFDRFYRVDKGRSRKSGGTGLGLAIVRSSINTIGGSISVRNGNGRGLEFIFTLRRWKVSSEMSAKGMTMQIATPNQNNQNNQNNH